MATKQKIFCKKWTGGPQKKTKKTKNLAEFLDGSAMILDWRSEKSCSRQRGITRNKISRWSKSVMEGRKLYPLWTNQSFVHFCSFKNQERFQFSCLPFCKNQKGKEKKDRKQVNSEIQCIVGGKYAKKRMEIFELRSNSDWVISAYSTVYYFYLGLNYLPVTSSSQMVSDFLRN